MSIDRIRDRHHGLARDLADGYALDACYQKWGFQYSTAKYLANHHCFKELIGSYKIKRRKANGEYNENEPQRVLSELHKSG